ncbi:hypothetical protein AZE42_05480 [Rhizopogon vesiculosus]|uniref:Uncharacterized protein n=1 Tax=Rhizopogon vesiculosus TaxID=180088 RepID=A0A1J8PV75_9AGAM|nr:hypothetical protein AZE42_05480 [Rhizopogon vesiculosus]
MSKEQQRNSQGQEGFKAGMASIQATSHLVVSSTGVEVFFKNEVQHEVEQASRRLCY